MGLFLQLLALLLGTTVLVFIRHRVKEKEANPTSLPLPPGPKPLPLIGNVKDMPTSFEWLSYAEWAKEYGEIVHVKVLDKHIMILNTIQAASEIFEKRSALYSDRPRMPMVNELSGWTWAFTFMHYGASWRARRKAFHQYFYPAAIVKYQASQTTEARKLLLRLLTEPEDFMQLIRHSFASMIMRVCYGIEISEASDDPYVDSAEKVMASIAEAGIPGAFLVDTIPILKYVPEWFPGAGFQTKARRWAELMSEFVEKPFEEVKRMMAAGTAPHSISTEFLEKIKGSTDPEEERIAMGVTAVAYAGGADTTVSTLQTFFMTMVLHPEAMRKAQAQIDEVVGRARLPTFDDIESLPYIQAIVKEIMRWQPVTPLAIAHRATENDVYKGYFIPKGSLVIGNAWLILHDPKTYEDPLLFKPERFLKEDGTIDKNVQDPEVAAFGFGRRICPGRHLAIKGALITVASILAVFDIEQDFLESSEPCVTEVKTSSGLLCYPLPFKCKIMPRWDGAETIIRQSLDKYD